MQPRRLGRVRTRVAAETMVRPVGLRFDARLILAVGAVWLLWGSTFAAMRYALVAMPPFAMASMRFLLAGAILYAICVVRGKARVRRDDLVHAAVTGGILLV